MWLFTDKKALSEMISYVLLIIIALALSAVVYNYLTSLTPKEKAECPEDISLYLSEARCNITSNKLSFEYTNSGLFKTEGIYVRFGNISSTVRKTLNNNQPYFNPSNPGENIDENLSISGYIAGNYTLEIQPLVKVKKQYALCEKVIVTKDVECLA